MYVLLRCILVSGPRAGKYNEYYDTTRSPSIESQLFKKMTVRSSKRWLYFCVNIGLDLRAVSTLATLLMLQKASTKSR